MGVSYKGKGVCLIFLFPQVQIMFLFPQLQFEYSSSLMIGQILEIVKILNIMISPLRVRLCICYYFRAS